LLKRTFFKAIFRLCTWYTLYKYATITILDWWQWHDRNCRNPEYWSMFNINLLEKFFKSIGLFYLVLYIYIYIYISYILLFPLSHASLGLVQHGLFSATRVKVHSKISYCLMYTWKAHWTNIFVHALSVCKLVLYLSNIKYLCFY
jgi:hypothetical protein